MAMDAIAVLRATSPEIEGSPYIVRLLDDGVLVATGARFDSPPSAIGVALRLLLGEALDLHQDPRGVFVYPDVVEAQGRTYDAVLDEMGEGGFWCPMNAEAGPEGPEAVEAMMAGLADVQTALAADGGVDVLSLATRLQQALGGPEQMEAMANALLGALAGEGPPAAEVAAARGEGAPAQPRFDDVVAHMRGLAAAMQRRPGEPPGVEGVPGEGQGGAVPEEAAMPDLGSLIAQARDLAAHLDVDPAELAQIERALGGHVAEDDEGDGDDGAPGATSDENGADDDAEPPGGR